jgi:hypothetical protein
MTKAQLARRDSDTQAPEPAPARRRPQRGRGDEEQARPAAALRFELARVRARFGVVPATPIAPEPWASPTGAVEEDEAEFADALADCLSVGLPLHAAVASWASGELAQDEEEDEPPELLLPELFTGTRARPFRR